MIIVLGPGRSGTSLVARLLHNNLGIKMGDRFREPDASNPKGFFEDLDFRDLNQRRLTNKCSNEYFQTQLAYLVHLRRGDWGIKDPRICNLWQAYQKFPAQYIVCDRRPQLIIKSLVSNYGWTEYESRQFLMQRLLGIAKLLEGRDALRLDFTFERDETQLTHLLERFLR